MSSSHQLLSLEKLELRCKEILDPSVYDFIAGGAGTEWGLQNNRSAIQDYQIAPRIMQNVSCIDTSLSVLGVKIKSPIIMGPVAFHKLVCPEGELATAKVAEKVDTIMTLSTMSSFSIEEVSKATDSPKWFQLYVYKDYKLTERLIKRAELSGYKAIVLTCDVPAMGIRQRDISNKFSLPSDVEAVNFKESNNLELSSKINGSKVKEQTDQQFASNFSWEIIDWLKTITKLPVIIKGVLNEEDALQALKHDVSAIIVSNHGGRQLDSVIASIDALPLIKLAVGNRMPIFVDGGFRSGEDIFKALALGADAVLLARPILWSLAVGGEETLISTLEELHSELELTMRLTGCPSLDAIHEKGWFLLRGQKISSLKEIQFKMMNKPEIDLIQTNRISLFR